MYCLFFLAPLPLLPATFTIWNYNTGTLKITYYWMMDERGHLLAIIKKYQTKRRRSLQLWCHDERGFLYCHQWRGKRILNFMVGCCVNGGGTIQLLWARTNPAGDDFSFVTLAPPPPVWPSPALRSQQLRFWRVIIIGCQALLYNSIY